MEGVYVNEEEEEGAVKGKGVGVETSPARECREGMLPDLAAATGPFTCDLKLQKKVFEADYHLL